ncbi:DUF3253 domain-containing protein [Aureimonas sp. ME7]|uniref:DUF3253 domain-containing protein n=1 Tax=Aureimonas sp. ME7 TaxID=2744252 RepID=UPI0015F702E3|nr:DUF3253 domain-containing protein [Aureimonas sp. ME7]
MKPKFSAETLRQTMLRMVEERGPDKTVCPSEVARALAGSNEKEWRLLMQPIRQEAVRLAEAGNLVIKRKGKPLAPADLKGIYRLAPKA